MGNDITDRNDWEAFEDEISEQLQQALSNIIEGAIGDVETFATEISKSLLTVADIEDDDRRESARAELLGQVRNIAEIQRIRASEESWRIVEAVVDMAGRTLFGVMRAAAAGI